MARTEILVNTLTEDTTKSVEHKTITLGTTFTDGISIKQALKNKNNSLFIIVTSSAASKSVTIKAGNEYPNKMLGDLTIDLTKDKPEVIQLEDISRFENRDGSIYLDFTTGMAGSIYCIAKRAGMEAAANQ